MFYNNYLRTHAQDEMKALQRLNTIFFLIGYLGFVASWIMDLILLFTQVSTVVHSGEHYCSLRSCSLR